ncbi:MAG: hypothetical protein AB8G16_17010 [Gammaproteobacteria bacterium]
MTTRAFQSAVARLVIEPSYAHAVRAGHGIDPMLSPLEQRRLISVARDGGLAITRTLHQGFRLNKIIGRAPLCRTLLGERGMAVALEDYWSSCLPMSFYYMHEALAFTAYLRDRAIDMNVAFLGEVAAFEHAALQLQTLEGRQPDYFEAVPFQHDPAMLLSELRDGVVPATVRRTDVVLIGSVDARACAQWHTMSSAAWRAWQRSEAVA